jgi:hypothetical protein
MNYHGTVVAETRNSCARREAGNIDRDARGVRKWERHAVRGGDGEMSSAGARRVRRKWRGFAAGMRSCYTQRNIAEHKTNVNVIHKLLFDCQV